MTRPFIYNTLVVSVVPGEPFVAVEVLSQTYNPPSFIYRVPFAYVEPDELDLNAGRFIHYVGRVLPYHVTGPVDTSMMDIFTERLEWIGWHIMHPWSFDIHMKDVTSGTLRWMFDNALDAIRFRLTF